MINFMGHPFGREMAGCQVAPLCKRNTQRRAGQKERPCASKPATDVGQPRSNSRTWHRAVHAEFGGKSCNSPLQCAKLHDGLLTTSQPGVQNIQFRHAPFCNTESGSFPPQAWHGARCPTSQHNLRSVGGRSPRQHALGAPESRLRSRPCIILASARVGRQPWLPSRCFRQGPFGCASLARFQVGSDAHQQPFTSKGTPLGAWANKRRAARAARRTRWDKLEIIHEHAPTQWQ